MKVLQLETWWLNGGVNYLLKRRSAREKKTCDRRSIKIIIMIKIHVKT
jgi:hypothetical protein